MKKSRPFPIRCYRFPTFVIYYLCRHVKLPKKLEEFKEKFRDRYFLTNGVQSLSRLLNTSEEEIWEIIKSYHDPHPKYIPHGVPYREMLYAITILCDLKTVVETGVSSGSSSYAFLQGLKETGGELYSIDINPNVGQLVPPELRKNWKLLIGDSRKILPRLLKELRKIDAFFHDSLHTYEFMLWEYMTCWPYVQKLLLSDDVDVNLAFTKFAQSVKRKPYYIYNRLGIIRK